MNKRQSIRWISPTWLVLCLCLSFAVSCQKPPIKINLISNKVSYKPEEPIKIQIRVFNDNTNIFDQKKPVIARRGFFFQNFHSLLFIIDPNGKPLAKIHPESLIEPAPPYRVGKRFTVPVEIIPPDGENVWVMNDVRKYYHLGNTEGWYTADVRASLETFCRYKEGPTGEPYAKLSSFWNKTYNPLSSNKIRFEIAPAEPPLKAALKLHVNLLTATGGSQQKVSALENADVRLYRVSKIPPIYKPISRKVYGIIWNNDKSQQSRLTYANGTATFSGIEQDDYLILARHPVFADLNVTGTLVNKDDSEWRAGGVIELSLSVTRKPDGTVVPGNTGKVLEGMKAIQFTMNDVGSRW